MFPPLWRALLGLLPARLATVGSGLLLVAALGLSSCAQEVRGELTAAVCRNERDDDEDLLVDCSDPDCWVFCPPSSAGTGSGPDSTVSDARVPDAEVRDPPPDAGVMMSMPEDDSGMPDASADPDDSGVPPECGTCQPGEECIDGRCQRIPLDGDYDISVRSAVVPLAKGEDECFDYDNPTCFERIFLVCECIRPDPYVVVLLDDEVLSRATTTERYETASAVWTDAPTVRVALTESSKLTFVVYDWDGIGTDTEIFRCSPDLSPLSSGTDVLTCTPDASMTVTPPRGSNFSVAVSVKKAE